MSKITWILGQISKKLWVHVSAYAVMGLIVAIAASQVSRYVPVQVPFSVSSDAIDSLLSIIASSMLAVTTFSVGSLTSAYSSATSNGTARATTLLTEDDIVQSALATFIGSFLFSIVGMVALRVSAYGEQGRVILFIVTLLVIALIVVALLRWINQLTKLGRVADTITRIESATKRAMEKRVERPFLGARPLPIGARGRDRGLPVTSRQVGYAQFIDTATMSEMCDELQTEIDILLLPGSFAYDDTVIAVIYPTSGPLPEGIEDKVRRAFEFGPNRSFDQDPRFGLVVLSEVALRALSPAVNDPGTAIDVIGRQTRLLTYWGDAWASAETQDPIYANISVLPIAYDDLYEDAFNIIARDGSAQIDVMSRLLKSLTALTRVGPAASRNAARRQLHLAYQRSLSALGTEDEKNRLTGIYGRAGGDPNSA